MRKLLSLLLVMGILLSIAVPFTAFAETEGDFEYMVFNSEATITGYTGSATELVIPDILGGYPVTTIGKQAFECCDSLMTSVTIPNSVTTIGYGAFIRCYGLTSVTIPNSVTTIGSWAFFGCNSLTSVYISDIAAWCAINFGTSDSNPLDFGANLYLNGQKVVDLVISNGVTTIGAYAFHGCDILTSVTIPNSVTTIGDSAFEDCDSLTSVTIPDSVTTIGAWAFSDCDSLTSVTIPNSVTTIGNYAFQNCESLTSVAIPDSVTSIGNDSFKSCENLTIFGKKGSYAEKYAINHWITFETISVYGDLDGDNKVSAADALEVLKSVVGKANFTEQQRIAADTDGNNKVDAADALNVLKKVVGKIQKFPVEE